MLSLYRIKDQCYCSLWVIPFAVFSILKKVLHELGTKIFFHNLQCVQELRKPPTESGTESGEPTAVTWKWFSLMDEAIGGRPSIQPPCLITSAWGENPSISASASLDSVPSEPGSQTPEPEEPGPSKLQQHDPILELLERAEQRARRKEAREERLLNLLEKIVEKM